MTDQRYKVIYSEDGESSKIFDGVKAMWVYIEDCADLLNSQDNRIAELEAQLKAAQPEVCMDNLRHCILMALNDCLVAEVGPGHSIINIDGEALYNRVRGILDAITPLQAPPEK